MRRAVLSTIFAMVASPALAADPDPVPAGFVEMTVIGVMPTDEGQAVILTDEKKEAFLPIWIGGTEALSIQLRLERRRFERPLTHDLLDSLVKELGGQLIKVHIDDLKSGTFTATLYLRRGDKTIEVDARPSDSIALALGNKIPIYVSKKVVSTAGVKAGDKDRDKLPSEKPLPLPKSRPNDVHTL